MNGTTKKTSPRSQPINQSTQLCLFLMAAIIDRSEGADFFGRHRVFASSRETPTLSHLATSAVESSHSWTNNPVGSMVSNMAGCWDEQWKKKHGCLGYIGDITQLNGDYFINHYKDPVFKQPGFPMGKVRDPGFFRCSVYLLAIWETLRWKLASKRK